jgi:hypothetical protein
MGYYSEVGLRIEFANQEGRDKIVAALGDDMWGYITKFDDTKVEETGIRFHVSWVKWYPEMPWVTAFEALVMLAEERNSLEEGDPDRVPSSGFFARVGEELNDIDTRYWNSDDPGVPDGYELGDIVISIDLKED